MKKCIEYLLMFWSLFFFAWGILGSELDFLLIAVCILWCHNVLWCFPNFRKHFFVLIMHMTIFLFLVSCPFISIIKGYDWKTFDDKDLEFALTSINISLCAIYIGALLGDRIFKNNDLCKVYSNDLFCDNLRRISLFLYCLSMPAYLYLEMEKIIFMQGKTYADYYTGFVSSAPLLVYILASFMKYTLCIFLSTLPSKKDSFFPLFFFLVSAIPSLFIGLRNPIMLNILFVFSYYFMRDCHVDKEKWIGKIERILMVILIPVTLIFMGAYNYIRDGSKIELSISDLLIDFIYRQGVSFNVLSIGHASISKLPNYNIGTYTFGGFVDYFLHGTIAQKVFGAESLGSGNSVKMGMESHSFAHNMSYVARDGYLEGHGWGSSYLLETYVDFGYVGVIIFSFLLGMVLVAFATWFIKRKFITLITLVCISKVFYIPRSAATEWLEFIVAAQFWIPVIFCYFGAGLCCKKYTCLSYRKESE